MIDLIVFYVLFFGGGPISGPPHLDSSNIVLSVAHYDPGTSALCKDKDCVRKHLELYPGNKLRRVVEVEMIGNQVTLKEMDIVSSHDIKEKKK